MSSDKLIYDVLAGAVSTKVLVAGDLILDRYTWGSVPRVSPEAPVMVLRSDREESRLGGAASVANLLRGLDVEVALAGVIGADKAGRELLGLARGTSINGDAIVVDRERQTTTKQRFIGRAANRHPHQMLRVDHEDTFPLNVPHQVELLEKVRNALRTCHALLISDYAKGVCTPKVLQSLIHEAKSHRIPVIVDPARITNYSRYAGATLVTPNRAETELVTGKPIHTTSDAESHGLKICSKYSLEALLITLDREGMVHATHRSSQHYPTRPRSVYDVTGAGDMVLAVSGFGLGTGLSAEDTIRLSNLAAGLEVEKIGVVPITRSELLAEISYERNRVMTDEQIIEFASRQRDRGKIVLVRSRFEHLDVNDIIQLQRATTMGDCTIVIVDDSGFAEDSPKEKEKRALAISAMKCVSGVAVSNSPLASLVKSIRPEVVVAPNIEETRSLKSLVNSYGGTLVSTL